MKTLTILAFFMSASVALAQFQPPRIKYKVNPEYTDQARVAGLHGTVRVKAIVGQDGKVKAAAITRSLGMGLDQKAIDAVNQWLFAPATKDGVKIETQVDIELNFQLRTNIVTQFPKPLIQREESFSEDVVPEYPFQVRIVETHWENGYYGGAQGWGYANILMRIDGTMAGKMGWEAFDYGFSCEHPFIVSVGPGYYPAKWKKFPNKLIIQMGEFGNAKKRHTCELKVTLRPGESYVSDAAGIRAVSITDVR